MFKKFFGVMLIASGIMVFVNLVVIYAPTMLSASLIEHLTVVGKLAAAAVLISFGGIAFTSKKKTK